MGKRYSHSERSVDVETPSPGDIVGKGASKEGTGDTCDCEYGTKGSKEYGTLFDASDFGDDTEDGDKDATGADSGKRSTKDENFGGRSSTANDVTNPEGCSCNEADLLCREEGKELSVGQLEARLT
jgi:hypothetical protein